MVYMCMWFVETFGTCINIIRRLKYMTIKLLFLKVAVV